MLILGIGAYDDVFIYLRYSEAVHEIPVKFVESSKALVVEEGRTILRKGVALICNFGRLLPGGAEGPSPFELEPLADGVKLRLHTDRRSRELLLDLAKGVQVARFQGAAVAALPNHRAGFVVADHIKVAERKISGVDHDGN